MPYWESIILGIVQGATEFLPVSSSGHLMLAQHLLGMKDLEANIVFSLVCHLGTLLSIFVIFWRSIWEAMTNVSLFIKIVIGTLPLFPLVLALHFIKSFFENPFLLGFAFLFTALLLFSSSFFRIKPLLNVTGSHPYLESLGIGLFQAIAVLPGISRSGSTISAARFFNWTPQESVTFSFLLAIPAILGSVVIEIADLILKKHELLTHMDPIEYAVGFIVSFLVGLIALKIVVQLTLRNRLSIFAIYCAILGVFCLYYFA